MTARALPRLDEDDRLVPILDHLSQGFLAGVSSEYTSPTDESGETIRAEHVDELARKHFPMCMRNLHDNLKKDKHLRHFGRQQYNLFLKVRPARPRDESKFAEIPSIDCIRELAYLWRRL